MQSYTRHQLKEDKFQEVTRGAIQRAQAHRQQLTLGAIVVLVVVLAAGGYGYWRSQQDEQASAAMGLAMNTYAASIRAPGAARTAGGNGPARSARRAGEFAARPTS